MPVSVPVRSQARGETADLEQAKEMGSGQVGKKSPLGTLTHTPQARCPPAPCAG